MISIQTSKGLQTKHANKVAISVRAVQGISHRKKILPQILLIELSLVASK